MGKRICKNCRNWGRRSSDFNICYGIKTGKDIRINTRYIQTAMDFSCNKFKELKNDKQDNTIPTDSING
jgi:hypothetical protein